MKRIVIYGGKGALGSACVAHFKSQDWWVGNIDLVANDQADVNIILKPEDDWCTQAEVALKAVGGALQGEKLAAVICVAGGWAGGNAASKDLIKNSDLMWKQSVWTSVISGQLASQYLTEGGLLTLTGAQPALQATPGMMGYGLAKAAVHQFVQSLAGENSGLPANSTTVAILPITLDTPMNRKFMAKADQSAWTPLEFVAKTFHDWTLQVNRPANGSLVQLVTKNGKTELVPTKF